VARFSRPARTLGFELLVAYLGFSGGILLATGTAIPESVRQSLPSWVTIWWGIQLSLGCTLVLYALFRGRLLVEKAGLTILGPAAIVYAVVAFSYIGWNSIFAATPYLLFGYACWDRITLINSVVKAAVRE
jgi:hypothetical protein